MRTHLLATVSIFTLASTAYAADEFVPYGTVADWTGPYVGLNGGFIRHRAEADFNEVGLPTLGTGEITDTGATFGAQAGYNWQHDNFVFGAEADLNWVGGSKSVVCCSGTTFSSELDWLATVRGRAGITLSPTLLYLTGGLAVGRVKNEADIFGNGAQDLISDERTRVGWTAGAGVEHMFASNWTAKAELLYVDLGSKTAYDQAAMGGDYAGRFKNTAVIGRVGINFKW